MIRLCLLPSMTSCSLEPLQLTKEVSSWRRKAHNLPRLEKLWSNVDSNFCLGLTAVLTVRSKEDIKARFIPSLMIYRKLWLSLQEFQGVLRFPAFPFWRDTHINLFRALAEIFYFYFRLNNILHLDRSSFFIKQSDYKLILKNLKINFQKSKIKKNSIVLNYCFNFHLDSYF